MYVGNFVLFCVHTGPVFVAPVSVVLDPVDSTHRRWQLHVVEQNSSRLVLRLPTFNEACGSYGVDECEYGLSVTLLSHRP